ncbi:MAG: F0F1 ATP synthase subunit beta, partial [Patescibacteria group bacterium]
MKNQGKVVQVIGPVVDVEFSNKNETPAIYTTLKTYVELNDPSSIKTTTGRREIVLEIAKHLEPGRVRTIALSSTDGLKRYDAVENTGEMISVPVGPTVLGNIFDVIGNSLGNPTEAFTKSGGKIRWPIHRAAPPLVEQSTKTEIFETGIKVIDLIAPFIKGGKI